MKPEKSLRIIYGIILILFCVLFFLYSDFIIAFKLALVPILVLIPLGISYILSKIIKTRFIVLLNLANTILVFFLICWTIAAVGDVIREKKYDKEEANMDYSKDTELYIRAIRKRAAIYLHKKYANDDVETIGSRTFPLADSNYSPKNPNIIHDIFFYVNGAKKDNMRVVRLKFDSNLNYSVIYDIRSDEDSTRILNRSFYDSLKSQAH